MSRLPSSSRSRLGRLIVIVLAGLSPMVVPAGVSPAGAPSFPLYSSRPLAGTAGTPKETTYDPDHPHRELRLGFAEEVRSMALDGNRLFLGGFFSGLVDGSRNRVQPATPFLAVVDASAGKPAADQTFARN